MKTAPVTLLEYFVSDLSFTANREYAMDKPLEYRAGDFGATPSVLRSPTAIEQRRWQVSLEIKHVPPAGCNFPYAYRVVLTGFFRAEPDVAPENEERMVRIQGASVLYGMGREIVRAMTGRGPHRPVLLPTVSFYDPPPASTAHG
jgi:preprotein translocase subunit SecB